MDLPRIILRTGEYNVEEDLFQGIKRAGEYNVEEANRVQP